MHYTLPNERALWITIVPVTDEAGVLSGFISRTDILRAVAADPPLDLWSGPAVPL